MRGPTQEDVVHIDNEEAKGIRMSIIVDDRLRVVGLGDPHD